MCERHPPDEVDTTDALLLAGYRYARALDPQGEEAEDMVHDAWLKLEVAGYARPERPLLYRTIRNLWIDRERRRQRFPSVAFDESDTTHPTWASANERNTGGEDPALERGLMRLRAVEREALFLMVVEGCTATETASLMRSSRGTVLSLVHRAKAKLRGWLNDAEAPTVDIETGTVVIATGRQSA